MATVSGAQHPLIVMSHGTGGMALNSYDTAIALAEAGFIVAAVTHTGDNYRDHSASFTRRQFVGRPRHISRVIDFMLGDWAGHGSIDPRPHRHIWPFGGRDDGIDRRRRHRRSGAGPAHSVETHADDWGCQQARQRGSPTGDAAPRRFPGRDSRIKAIVMAAPALAVAFQPAGLAAVHVPVQLWVGSQGRDRPRRVLDPHIAARIAGLPFGAKRRALRLPVARAAKSWNEPLRRFATIRTGSIGPPSCASSTARDCVLSGALAVT